MILSQLRQYMMADILAGNAIELVSSSGRGKSEFCFQMFEYLCKLWPDKTLGFTDMFLATQTPPDLIGYQFKGTGEAGGVSYTRSEASLPLWMQTKFVRVPVSKGGSGEIKKMCIPAWMCDHIFLLLDEFGQGEADVKRSAAQLFLKGEIGPWQLPYGSIRVACSNQGARYGVTKDFDFSITRRSIYKITDDLKSWLDWADHPYEHEGQKWMVMPVTKAFANQNGGEVLFEKEPKEQGPWCNPRSLCAADRYLQMVEKLFGKINPDDPAVCEGLAAKIGVPAAGHYAGFLRFRLELPSYEQVVADPDNTPVPVKADMQMLMAYELAARTIEPDMPSVIKYMTKRSKDDKGMPKDMAITFAVALIKRDKTLLLSPAFAAWVAQNATLLALIQSLSN